MTAWITPARARLYGGAWLLLAGLLVVLFARHLAGWTGGRPIDTDFASFYAASALALEGRAGAAWDSLAHAAMQAALLGPGRVYAFFYPPHYLLALWPLALLPALGAYAAWVVATGALLALALRRMGLGWLGVGVLLASPVGLLTVMTGQNAFLTAGLFAWAGLLMDRRPVLAGACLGLLTMKPQLGLMVPVALVAGRRWPVVVAAVVASLALVGLSLLAFGPAAWAGFLGQGGAARSGLEGRLEIWKMQSLYAALLQLGAAPLLAYAAQALGAVLVLAWCWPALARRPSGPATAALAAVAGLLMTPFLQFYDFCLLLPAMAFLLRSGPPLPWERLGLVALFAGPGLSFALGDLAGLPIGPLVAVLAVWLVRRRLVAGAGGAGC